MESPDPSRNKGPATVNYLVGIIILLLIALVAVLEYNGSGHTVTATTGNSPQTGQPSNAMPSNTTTIESAQSARQMFLSQANVSDNVKNMKLKYWINLNISPSLSEAGNLTIYVLNNQTVKSTTDLGNEGIKSLYYLNGTGVQCNEVNSTTQGSGELNCEGFPQPSPISEFSPSYLAPAQYYKYVNIDYEGVRQVAGSQCNQYMLTVTPENLSEISGDQGSEYLISAAASLPKNSTLHVSDCLGVSTNISYRLSFYFTNSTQNVQNAASYLNLTATSISNQSFNTSFFEVPIKVQIGAINCYPGYVFVTLSSFINSDNETLVVSNLTAQNNQSLTISSRISKLTVGGGQGDFVYLAQGEGLPISTYEHPSVCISGSCYQSKCYVTEPASPPQGDYNTTTGP